MIRDNHRSAIGNSIKYERLFWLYNLFYSTVSLNQTLSDLDLDLAGLHSDWSESVDSVTVFWLQGKSPKVYINMLLF